MAQRLETFAKRNRFVLEFQRTTEETTILRSWEEKRYTRIRWTCYLHSAFLGQGMQIWKKGRYGREGGTLFGTSGATKKEAREKLLKQIRGGEIRYGCEMEHKVKVPTDLK